MSKMSQLNEEFWRGWHIGYQAAEDDLRNVATKVVVVKHGRWIKEPNCWYRCSVCGEHYPSISGNMKYNYCPSCGTRMNGEE